jgi:hypothetical protein
MPSIKKLLQAAAGNAGGESLYVEDVFSTYLYTPSISNSNIPINNGIDLDGEGGMVWFKKRTGGTQNHSLVDTVRGGTNLLTPNGDFAAYSADIVSSFNTDGFKLALHLLFQLLRKTTPHGHSARLRSSLML